MKIKNLSIENFRGLDSIHLAELDEHVNLFVGANGAGKSSVLDAIAIVFSWYVARMLSPKGRGKDIPKDDISQSSANGSIIELQMDDESIWKIYRSLKYKKNDRTDLTTMTQFISNLREKLDSDPSTPLPVVAYYNVNRVIPNCYPRMTRSKSVFSQLDTYKNCLSGNNLFIDFFNWFRQSEDYENERYKENDKFQDHGLEAVRQAMECTFPGYTDMKVSRRPLALTMKKGNETFKLTQLSDGEKCYISLVGDIARRLAIANPDKNPLVGDGIILIDEIDLHLHPKWQQTVISKLIETFPNCQFFITTHSSLVASDVIGKIFSIKNGKVTTQQTYGKLSSNILSSVFELPSARNINVQSIIDTAYGAIRSQNINCYQTNLDKLINILGADDPEIAGLRIEKIRWEQQLRK